MSYNDRLTIPQIDAILMRDDNIPPGMKLRVIERLSEVCDRPRIPRPWTPEPPSSPLDRDEYPTDECLEWIRNFEMKERSDIIKLMDFIGEIWWSADWGFKRFRLHEGYRKYTMSTGGWSGNESIIAALRSNRLVWSFSFCNHRTGGHYTFRVKVASTE